MGKDHIFFGGKERRLDIFNTELFFFAFGLTPFNYSLGDHILPFKIPAYRAASI